MLLDELRAVEQKLEARGSQLRPAEALSRDEVRENALVSLIEKLNDQPVAPLFCGTAARPFWDFSRVGLEDRPHNRTRTSTIIVTHD